MPLCLLARLLGYKVVPGLDFIFKKLFHLTRDKEEILNSVLGHLYTQRWSCVGVVLRPREQQSHAWPHGWSRERSRFYLFMPPVQQSICFSTGEDMNQGSHLLQPGLRCLFVYLTCLREGHREFVWFLGWGRKGIRIKILFQVSITTSLKLFSPLYAMFFHPNCKSRNYPQGSLINKDWGCRACCHWSHSPAWLSSLKNLPLDKFYLLLHLHNPRNYVILSLKNNDVENARQIFWLCII